MELFDTTQLGLERALAGASRRQEAIASNLANVNTPGYQRKDVEFHDALRRAFDRDDRKAVLGVEPAEQVDRSAPMRQDGNAVDLDTEAAAQAKNGLEYEALTAVMKARTAILKSAMGVG
ncbi:MAG: flagellar basal body rod protein FlgB [Solirubrobacterales bacterium]|nr:flagellar basal body rod protein FlgB [Solirubrobacterales bacterium]